MAREGDSRSVDAHETVRVALLALLVLLFEREALGAFGRRPSCSVPKKSVTVTPSARRLAHITPWQPPRAALVAARRAIFVLVLLMLVLDLCRTR
jgi:hypothetical protein